MLVHGIDPVFCLYPSTGFPALTAEIIPREPCVWRGYAVASRLLLMCVWFGLKREGRGGEPGGSRECSDLGSPSSAAYNAIHVALA
jgi:hypothetical protein